MANTGKPAPAPLTDRLRSVLRAHVSAGARLCLGYSGGLDSTVLLHLLAAERGPLGLRLHALHVHHGLSPRAEDWQRHCEAVCLAWDVPLRVERVAVERGGKGLEAAARAARYAAYARQEADFIVLAHQLDDQAETVLLNLLRGSGARGLAAMPVCRPLADAPAGLLRPLLGVSRAELEDYARRHGLEWVADESNLDTGLARNRLRHAVMPPLGEGFPDYRQALARAAGHMAECSELLDDLARLDRGPAADDSSLDLSRLSCLSPARAANLLRYHLRRLGLDAPSAAALEALRRQLTDPARDTAPCWHQGGTILRAWRGRLYATGSGPEGTVSRVWQGEEALEFAGGRLGFRPATGQGLSLARLAGRRVTLRTRQGGERMKLEAARPRRTLKNLLRESAIPPWERSRLPLLFVDDELAWAAGVGLDPGYRALAGEAGLLMDWRPPSPRP